MKLQYLTAVLVGTLSTGNVFADEAKLDDSLRVLLGNAPSEQTIQVAFAQYSDHVLQVLTTLLSNEAVDPQTAITQALTAAPEKVGEIVDIAREFGVSNETITTSALLAGLDPTTVAEATAAGIQTAAATTQSIAPPVAPAIGSDGGGGNAVVSPN